MNNTEPGQVGPTGGRKKRVETFLVSGFSMSLIIEKTTDLYAGPPQVRSLICKPRSVILIFDIWF